MLAGGDAAGAGHGSGFEDEEQERGTTEKVASSGLSSDLVEMKKGDDETIRSQRGRRRAMVEKFRL